MNVIAWHQSPVLSLLLAALVFCPSEARYEILQRGVAATSSARQMISYCLVGVSAIVDAKNLDGRRRSIKDEARAPASDP